MALCDVLSVCCLVQIGLTNMTRMVDKCRHCRFVEKLEVLLVFNNKKQEISFLT